MRRNTGKDESEPNIGTMCSLKESVKQFLNVLVFSKKLLWFKINFDKIIMDEPNYSRNYSLRG